MAYMNQERKAKIAPEVKAILKKYGLKGSLSVNNHSTLVLNVKSGSIDFIGNFKENQLGRSSQFIRENQEIKYINVNPYWFHDHFSDSAKEFLTEVLSAMKGSEWYDNSDIQSDYFDTAYYVDVNIGRWDKPYILE